MSKVTIPNPCEEFVSTLKKAIKDNGGYCPCKIERTKDNKCKCKEFRENGICECGLYIQVDEDLV